MRLEALPHDDPMRPLALLCRQLVDGAGNLFLDASYESYGEIDLDWFEDFDRLTTEWQAAEPQLDQIKIFCDWMSADPESRIQATLDRLFSAQEDEDVRPI